MKKIIIVVPKDKEKWRVSMFGGTKRRTSATIIFHAIERRLRGYYKGEKLAIRVKYSKDTFNESLASSDSSYLLYTLGCFLEDYLSDKVMNRMEKEYANYEN